MAITHFDYAETLRRADDIEEAAQALDQARIRRLEDIQASLRASWSGEAANRFFQACAACGDELEQESKALWDLADRVRRAARAIEEAEARARTQVTEHQIRSL